MTQRVHPLTAVVVLAIVLVAIMIGYSRRLPARPAPAGVTLSQHQVPPRDKPAAKPATASCSSGACSAQGEKSCSSGHPRIVLENHSAPLPPPLLGE